MFKVVPVCGNELIASELTDILQEAETSQQNMTASKDTWSGLEDKHISLWKAEKERYLGDIQSVANYKLESISSNYRNRKRTLEQKIRDAFEEKIRRMYQGELNNATEKYQNKADEINERASRADIHTSLVANGIGKVIRRKDGFEGAVYDADEQNLFVHVTKGKDAGTDKKIQISFLIKNPKIYSVE